MTRPGWFRRSLEHVANAELPIVLLLSPVLLFPRPGNLLLALAIPIVWTCHWAVAGRPVPRTPLNPFLAVLLLMAAVSLFATFDVRFSLGKVCGVLLGVSIYWAVVQWTSTRARLQIAVTAFLLAGTTLALLGLLGADWFEKLPVLRGIVAHLPKLIRGVPGAEDGFQPNAVAGCLLLFVPLQVALLIARRPVGSFVPGARWPQAVGLVMTAGTLLLTQSRGAWMALAVTSVAAMAWSGRKRRLAAAALVAIGALATVLAGPQRLLNLAVSQSGPGMVGNIAGRMELWSRALDAIRDFPVTGVGMNAFRRVMPVLYPSPIVAPGVDIAHAHNHLLQAALDLGIPGLAAYLGVWVTIAVVLTRIYRRRRDSTHRALAGGLGAGLLAHFLFSLTDVIPLGAKVGVLFWLTLALCVSVYRVPAEGNT